MTRCYVAFRLEKLGKCALCFNHSASTKKSDKCCKVVVTECVLGIFFCTRILDGWDPSYYQSLTTEHVQIHFEEALPVLLHLVILTTLQTMHSCS